MKQKLQSTNHIGLIKPQVFFSNPQTLTTNPYQDHELHQADSVVLSKTLEEFMGFREMLVNNGIVVTTLLGHPDCPDHIFPNFFSTHDNGQAILFPMMAENRSKERTPEILDFIKRHYTIAHDLTHFEAEGKACEANASVCLDRVNGMAFAVLSKRTDEGLARHLAEIMGYDIVIGETALDNGLPVYHTDLMMFVGEGYAAVCFEVMTKGAEDFRQALTKLGHEVVEISKEQLNEMCGNALQVIGRGANKYLVMSSRAFNAYTDEQKAVFKKYVTDILHAPIPTIEKYGGGSARCLMQELF
jgi:hypothetical protein